MPGISTLVLSAILGIDGLIVYRTSRCDIIKIIVEREIREFFWDTDLAALDIRHHKTYIIERLLELGDERAVRWLFAAYSRPEIAEVVRKSRSLSKKSRSFWCLALDEADHV
jgi:hypothetical protein